MHRYKAFIAQKWIYVVILCIVAIGGWLRATSYGSLYLSIAMPDTQTYIDSSMAPTFSRSMFTSRRLVTTNLLYKLANDSSNCIIKTASVPTEGIELERTRQACFDNIVLLQNALSVISWSFLALITARWLKHPLNKILLVILILAFGFTPQIAEWDSILSSESLSLSLFPLFFGVLQEVVFRISGMQDKQWQPTNRYLLSCLLILFTLWVFVRDVHLYAILISIVLLIPFLFIFKVGNKVGILSILIGLSLLYLLGGYSARNSTRWQLSLEHVLDGYIFPYPARVDFFVEHGMPEDRSTADYENWFHSNAMSTYGRFLTAHPGFVLTTAIERMDYFESDFIQPYFITSDIKYHDLLMSIGKIVHPEALAVYLIDTLLLLSFLVSAGKRSDNTVAGWSWLAIWLFTYSGVSLVLSFFGDTDGIRRHIFPSVEYFRLFLWIFVLAIMDIAMNKPKPDVANATLIAG